MKKKIISLVTCDLQLLIAQPVTDRCHDRFSFTDASNSVNKVVHRVILKLKQCESYKRKQIGMHVVCIIRFLISFSRLTMQYPTHKLTAVGHCYQLLVFVCGFATL